MNNQPEVDPSPDTFPPGAIKYFIKEIASNAVTVVLPNRDGTKSVVRVPFEDLGDDTGFLAVDDPTKISAIRSLIRARRGGIREVGKEEFEAAKKVASTQEQRRASLRPKSLLNQSIRSDIRSDGAVDAAKAESAPRFPDPTEAHSVPAVEQIKKLIPADPVEVAARTPKAAKKRIKPPLAFSGAVVDP